MFKFLYSFQLGLSFVNNFYFYFYKFEGELEEYNSINEKRPIELLDFSNINDFCQKYKNPSSLCFISTSAKDIKDNISRIPIRDLNCTSKLPIVAGTQETCEKVNITAYLNLTSMASSN